MNNLRVLFMGTPDFALPSCKAIRENYNLVGVVTQPDRPKGRGGKVLPPPVKEFALQHNIPVWQPTVLKDGSFAEVLDETTPDLIVVAAYGRILPEYILNYPRRCCRKRTVFFNNIISRHTMDISARADCFECVFGLSDKTCNKPRKYITASASCH